MLKKLVLLISPFFLSGCLLTPEYVRPTNLAEKATVFKSGTKDAHLSIFDVLSEDKELMLTIKNALVNNYDVQASIVKIKASKRQAHGALLDYIPGVKLSAGRNISMSAYNSPIDNSQLKQKIKNYQSGIGLDSYELDIWGRKFNEYLSLEDKVDFSQSEAAVLRLTLVTEITKNWYDIRSLIKSWHLIKKKTTKVDILGEALLYADNMGRLDPMLLADFFRGKTIDEQYLINFEKEIINKINYIEFLSGYKSHVLNIDNWKSHSGDYKLPEFTSEITSDVIFRRPDVIQAEAEIQAANGEVGMARASLLPVFNLFANANHTSKSFNDVFDNLSDNWTISPSVIIPIFSFPKNYNNLQLAKSKQLVTIINYRKIIAQALMDIKESVQLVDAGKKLLSLNRTEVDRSNSILNKSEVLYQSGYGNIYSYYESLDIYSNAILEYENNRRHQMNNVLTLLKSLGG